MRWGQLAAKCNWLKGNIDKRHGYQLKVCSNYKLSMKGDIGLSPSWSREIQMPLRPSHEPDGDLYKKMILADENHSCHHIACLEILFSFTESPSFINSVILILLLNLGSRIWKASPSNALDDIKLFPFLFELIFMRIAKSIILPVCMHIAFEY